MVRGSNVKPQRRYDATGRQEAARRSRRRVLEAAEQLFTTNGYGRTTMRAIADAAGVSVKTVEAAFGTKANLLKVLVDVSIAGDDAPVAVRDRPAVREMEHEADPERFLVLFASFVRDISERLAPVARLLEQAAATEEEIAALWRTAEQNRLAGARAAAMALAAKADGVDVDYATDIFWLLNDPSVYRALVGARSWSPDRFEAWLVETSRFLLLGR